MRIRLVSMALLVVLLCGSATPQATTVRPLSFEQIAARADTIVLVQTVSVRSDWRTSEHGKHIITVVRFKIERALKGQVAQELQLKFLGGNIGGLVMEVDGVPAFEVGDRDVLFLSANRTSVSPVVGLFQGRFRVERDRATGIDRVLTYNRQPFTAAGAIGVQRLLARPASSSGPLSYAQFEALVLNTIAQAPAVK